MKIYYAPMLTRQMAGQEIIAGGLELASIAPEKLSAQIGMELCPASSSFMSNFYLVRSPMDIDLTFDGQRVWSDTFTQTKFDKFIRNRIDISTPEYAWVTVHVGNVFVSEEPCSLELYPAFLHGCPYEIAIGSFDISKWQRPADFTFKLRADAGTVKIKRGDPLYYVRLKPLKPNEGVKLERIDLKEVNDAVVNCTSVKEVQTNLSWKIATGEGNKWKKKTTLFQRIKGFFE